MAHIPQTQYKGIIIEESLENVNVLRDAQIIKNTVSEDGEWRMYTVLVSPEYLEQLAQNLKDGTWYAHFWNGRDVIAVFKGKTFRFNFDDKSTWEETLAHGRSLGIPEEQLDFPIDPSTSKESSETH
jgi:hypothetical protein